MICIGFSWIFGWESHQTLKRHFVLKVFLLRSNPDITRLAELLIWCAWGLQFLSEFVHWFFISFLKVGRHQRQIYSGSKHSFLANAFCKLRVVYEPGSKLLVLGMVIQPLVGNPYNGYINPYYWVDDHPLLYGNNGSLDPSTYDGFE